MNNNAQDNSTLTNHTFIDLDYLIEVLDNAHTGISHNIKEPIKFIYNTVNRYLLDSENTINNSHADALLKALTECKNTLLFIDHLLTYLNLTDLPLEKSENWSYPVLEEKMCIYFLKQKDTSLVSCFESTLDKIYEGKKENRNIADLMIKKLYHELINMAYSLNPWLDFYLHKQYFEEIDSIYEGNGESLKSFYTRKISYLIHFITKHEPTVSDNSLVEIISYILTHPEEDLKLKVVAALFFINNTYLSNIFYSKTGLYYNDYITTVKMSRAQYLFEFTDLKIYEISYRLGYKDINYFSKQFKKTFGLSPSDFRNNKNAITEYYDYQI